MSAKTIVKLVAGFILLVVLSLFVGVERIDAGSVGLKVNMTGASQGVAKTEYVTGWVFYGRLAQKVYEFPTFQQHVEYPEQDIITKGGFSAKIKPSFNYNLNSGSVADMFVNLRLPLSQIEEGWLKNAVTGSINDVANRWTVDDIFNNRERFEADIKAEVNKRVSRWFAMSNLRTNIVPPQSLQATIEAKTKAVQQAQAATAQVIVAQAQAQVDITNARKDSAVRVTQASGEAAAIKVQQEALANSPGYLQLKAIEKWSGNYPSTMLGGSTVPMINLKN